MLHSFLNELTIYHDMLMFLPLLSPFSPSFFCFGKPCFQGCNLRVSSEAPCVTSLEDAAVAAPFTFDDEHFASLVDDDYESGDDDDDDGRGEKASTEAKAEHKDERTVRRAALAMLKDTALVFTCSRLILPIAPNNSLPVCACIISPPPVFPFVL